MKDKTRQPPEHDDEIAKLIRLAGRRPAVPAERFDRVKAAVHDHWARDVRRRRRRWAIWTGAGVAAAASLIWVMSYRIARIESSAPAPRQVAATVKALIGTAWIDEPLGEDGRGHRTLMAHDEVAAGAEMVTGEDGRLELELAAAYTVRLDTGTRILLLGPEMLALDQGAVYVDSGRAGAPSGTLTIQTPLGMIREHGTQFEVRLGVDSVRVRVREGLVVLDDGRRILQVPLASELTLDKDGRARTRQVPLYGPEWDWLAQITTVPDLEGLSARGFLDWVARERGWRLSFASDKLARTANEIILGGSLDRLTLGEALDAVLPTCDMDYRVEDDSLIIGPASPAPQPE
ncbi:MAG: FecR family protein [Acidobacteriota bacterium]